jgi:putative phage-type endonuclease
MTPLIGPHQRTAEWYALRRNLDDPHFGATDAAGLLGVSAYRTPRHIYERFLRDEEAPDNDAMRLGRHLEPAVQSLYAEVHNRYVLAELPAAIHPTQPVFASVDSLTFRDLCGGVRLTLDDLDDFRFPNESDGAEILEIKTSFSPAIAEQLGEDGTDDVPTDWLCQVQQQMGVIGLRSATIAVLLYGKLRTFKVEANAEVILGIFAAARLMHERILNRDPPPLDWESPLTPDLVRAMRHDITGDEMDCTQYMIGLWNAQAEEAAKIDAATNKRKQLKAEFESLMLEHKAGAALLPNGRRVVLRERERAGYSVPPGKYWELRETKARR